METKDETSGGSSSYFRTMAHRALNGQEVQLGDLDAQQIQELFAELQAHQAELTRRNEELNRMHEELQASSQRYAQLYDYAPVGYVSLDAQGRIVQANLTCERLLGVEKEELCHSSFSDYVVSEDRSLFQVRLSKLFKSHEPLGFGVRMLRMDAPKVQPRFQGKLLPVQPRAVQFPAHLEGVIAQAEDGRTLARLALSDVSDRVQAEHERMRLATAIEQASECIIVTDRAGRILYVNPAFEDLSGYSRDEAIGMTPRILKSGKQDEAFYRELWGTLIRGLVWHGQFINKRKNGTLYYLQSTISPVRDETGHVVNYVSVSRDLTRETELEKRLRHTQRMEAIGTLAGGIAHDFNNILSAVIGYTELAMMELESGSRVYKNLDQVLRSGRRAADLVNQILTFSRQTEQEHRPISLVPVVKEVLKLMRGTLPSTIEIRHRIDLDFDGVILGDPTQIHQVLMNLCTNAYHAMRDHGGILEVLLSQTQIQNERQHQLLDLAPGNYIRLTISDTGHGMDEVVLQRLFEPYFTTKEAGEGTGLGLATVHGIVKSHHGEITVYSEQGQGSTFNIYLPCCTSQDGLDLDEESSQREMPRGVEHILYVDDEESIIRLGKLTLEHLGYTVTVFSNSYDALQDFCSRPGEFDLIITDQTMPELTGTELVQKALAVRPDIPIILCSGFSAALHDRSVQELGIAEFMMKPVVMKDLAEAIRRVLDQRTEPATS